MGDIFIQFDFDIDAYFACAKQKYMHVTHNSTVGKALVYSTNQDPYLRTILEVGAVPLDDNYAEQAIRPFTVGRKNFILTESFNGAKASAMIQSIVETAKANHLNVYQYLEFLLIEINQNTWMTIILRLINDLLQYKKSTCASVKNSILFQSTNIYNKQPSDLQN